MPASRAMHDPLSSDDDLPPGFRRDDRSRVITPAGLVIGRSAAPVPAAFGSHAEFVQTALLSGRPRRRELFSQYLEDLTAKAFVLIVVGGLLLGVVLKFAGARG